MIQLSFSVFRSCSCTSLQGRFLLHKINEPLSHGGSFKLIESIGNTFTKDLSEYTVIIASDYIIVKLVSTNTQPPFIFLGANLPGIERPLLKSSTVYLFLVKNDISLSDNSRRSIFFL